MARMHCTRSPGRVSSPRAAWAGMLALSAIAAAMLLLPLSSQRAAALAQQAPAPPVNGMRPVDLRTHVITNATVIPEPGKKLEQTTIVIRDGVIEWVGPATEAEAKLPAGAQTWDAEGLTVYPGLIESALLVSAGELPASAGAHWNAKIRAEVSMATQPPPDRATRSALRNMGFTTAAVYPSSGALRGSGTVLALADDDAHVRAYRERAAMMMAFEYGFRGGGGAPATPSPPAQAPRTPGNPPAAGERAGAGGYPSSLMGALALLRQTLLDAQWHDRQLTVWAAHPEHNEAPAPQDALLALQDVVAGKQPVLFDANDEHNALRADRLSREFDLDLWLLGSGLEFRRLEEIVATKRPIILPLEFPRRPEVGTIAQADSVSLQDLMTWEQAPTNARRLLNAGASVALTTYRLRDRSDFHANLRSAIKHGLTEDQALASLTTTPAQLLGIEHLVGTIAPGKAANLVVVKGNLFDKEGKIRDVWVNGRRNEISKDPRLEVKGRGPLKLQMEATPEITVEIDSTRPSVTFIGEDNKRTNARGPSVSGDLVNFTIDGNAMAQPGGFVRFGGAIEDTEAGFTITGHAALADGTIVPFTIDITPGEVSAPSDDGERSGRDTDDDEVEAGGDPITGDWTLAIEAMPDMSIGMTLKLHPNNSVTGTVNVMGQTMPLESGRFDPASGTLTLTSPTPTGQNATIEAKVSGGQFNGMVQGPQGEMPITGTREGATPPREDDPPEPEPDVQPATQPEEAPSTAPDSGRRRGQRGRGGFARGGRGGGDDEDAPFEMPPDNLNHPFGDYGLAAPPQPQSILLTNATIWTSGPRGVISDGVMHVHDGKIAFVGGRDEWTKLIAGARMPHYDTIDATGKHITPGLIDCHSHTGIDGGVNEGTQANTAEVRIGDCIDPDDINWYRQLAGGLTACNQLHGSANPIGGQNSVVKLKFGRPASDFPIEGAIPGIKFALGENVKRSTSRYPNTRMGVETFIRDAFTAAKDYRSAHQRYNALSADEKSKTMPPRRDLEMDTLVEILEGQRIVHCHSYRQDEILMLIRIADEFGFIIGTFQHVLEGYKVADAIAKHGAGASSFSDWWAYKIEVIDAIPYNGSLMNQVGCVVSFNSDSDELARRMNWEAAKAVRYGGMEPAEAMKFVTLNPAKQLKIDNRTGSLEQGKDADFVVWSGDPLSTYSRCEQTWIEGARYFDIDEDLKMRAEVDRERQRIIQKILKAANGEPAKPQASPQTAPETQPSTRPGTLLVRMLQQRAEWEEEQLRMGRDPDEMRPGDCGCSDLNDIYSNFGAEQ
jgi:imidazolonepropionase-like amidohydrolase